MTSKDRGECEMSTSISESEQEMSEQGTLSGGDFRTVLGEQRQRVVDAVSKEETIDATPIIRDDEDLSSEEYVTLVYELHHIILPELQASGVIEFNRRQETVRQGMHFDEARPLVEHDNDR